MKIVSMFFLSIISCQVFANDTYVYIMAGQSNMDGRALTKDIDPSNRHLLTIPFNVKMFDGAAAIDAVSGTVIASSAASAALEIKANFGKEFGKKPDNVFGPEVGFAHYLSAKYPNSNIVIFKYAVGGSTIAQWCLNNLEDNCGAHTDGKFYTGLLARYDDMKQKLEAQNVHNFIIKGVLWMQGENDVINAQGNQPHTEEVYFNRFNALIDNFRRDFGFTRNFAYGRVNDYDVSRWPIIPPNTRPVELRDLNAIRNAQARIKQTVGVTDNRHFVQILDTDDFTLRDNFHFDAKSMLRLGQCFGELAYKPKQLRDNPCLLDGAPL